MPAATLQHVNLNIFVYDGSMKKLLRTGLGVLVILIGISPLMAEIYKWTDEHGRVHFTDTPPEGSNSKPVDIGPINTYDAPSKILIDETLARSTGLPVKKGKVVVYSTTWCGVCTKAKKWLRANKVSFREYDVEKSPKGQRDYKRLKGRGVPIIMVGRQRMNGFSSSRMTEMLRKAGHKI